MESDAQPAGAHARRAAAACSSKVIDAEVFEQFLQNKFLGAKRFSLEGAESLIPLLDRLIERAARASVVEIVIGMAHRGRLNVLANVMEQAGVARSSPSSRTSVDPTIQRGGGDVKYHLGYSIDRLRATAATARKVHLSLAFNPSHLELVNTVVQGRVRAKQDRVGDASRTRCLPLLIHGDAAFAGQGIVAEALNMSELDGYTRRRHDPRRRQQPDRLHDLAARRALDDLRDRRRAHAADPDLPRQRRGSRRRWRRWSIWRSTSASASTATSSSTVLLPQARPQRGRRAVVHPAGHVPRIAASRRSATAYLRTTSPTRRRTASADHRRARPTRSRRASARRWRRQLEIATKLADAAASQHVRRRLGAASRAAPDAAVPRGADRGAAREAQRGRRAALTTRPADFNVHPKLEAS